MLLLIAVTRPAAAQAPAEPETPDFRRFHHTLGRNLTRGLFSIENLRPVVIGTGAAVLALTIDDAVSDELRGSSNALGETGHLIGHPVTVAVSTGGILVASRFIDDARFKSFAFSLAQAQVMDSLIKYSLKAVVSRTRPSAENKNSFPSGHTSATFAFASVAGHYYGKKVSIPAYIIASLVGVSRIEMGKHFPSDVVAGAVIGYVLGKTATRGTARFSRRGVTVVSVVGIGRVGVFGAYTPGG